MLPNGYWVRGVQTHLIQKKQDRSRVKWHNQSQCILLLSSLVSVQNWWRGGYWWVGQTGINSPLLKHGTGRAREFWPGSAVVCSSILSLWDRVRGAWAMEKSCSLLPWYSTNWPSLYGLQNSQLLLIVCPWDGWCLCTYSDQSMRVPAVSRVGGPAGALLTASFDSRCWILLSPLVNYSSASVALTSTLHFSGASGPTTGASTHTVAHACAHRHTHSRARADAGTDVSHACCQ